MAIHTLVNDWNNGVQGTSVVYDLLGHAVDDGDSIMGDPTDPILAALIADGQLIDRDA